MKRHEVFYGDRELVHRIVDEIHLLFRERACPDAWWSLCIRSNTMFAHGGPTRSIFDKPSRRAGAEPPESNLPTIKSQDTMTYGS